MEAVALILIVAVLLIRWIYWRNRMARTDELLRDLTTRVDILSKTIGDLTRKPVEPQPEALPEPEPPPLQPEPESEPEPILHISQPAPIEPLRFEPVAPSPTRTTEEWETLLGGNWLNKIGVFVLVVGIALALGYEFTQTGPWGRVVTSVAVGLAMLISGIILESRERYRNFARGLMGGGWAALYITVYAMHAIEAARLVANPILGTVLLFAVAAGMILHSLRYRSQTVTGVAYFVAFGTLAITDVQAFPFVALVPLGASLLYIAHRFTWSRMTALGLIATYAVVVLRGDTGAPLWEAQTIFAVYWLLFEIYDVLHPEAWLLPLNAAGFLGLSILKWQSAAPAKLWILLAAVAAAYLVSAAARLRSGKWHGAVTLAAALAAAAIFQRLDRQWVASTLVVEAELFYLAGWRLRTRYLRWLGSSLFALGVLRVIASDIFWLPTDSWVPVASLNAVVFYANRALVTADFFFGFAGAALLALVFGYEFHEPYRNPAWAALSAAAFAFGWWRRLFDFRLQGYLLFSLALAGTLEELRQPSLWVDALGAYAAVLLALWSEPARLPDTERHLVRRSAAVVAALALTTLAWRIVPGLFLGIAWIALAVLLLEIGLRHLPDEFVLLSFALAGIGAIRVVWFNVSGLNNTGPWDPRLIPLWAALMSYAIALRAWRTRGVFATASSAALVFFLIALWALLPSEFVSAAWTATALALLIAASKWPLTILGWQSIVLAAVACLRLFGDLPDLSHPVWPTCVAIACIFAAQLAVPRGSNRRLFYSLAATALTTFLLYFRISGKMLTVACGIEGAAWLALGFPLRDRVLRLSGLALLLACILKLFLWDLRRLETLPRIFSFIALGLILLAVSWAYTRFRERVAKYL